MRKQKWLGKLHMGHARHGDVNATFCLLEKGAEKRKERGEDILARLRHEHPEFSSDKLVATAPGVEFPGGWTEGVHHGFFGKMVDIFNFGAESINPTRIGINALGDFIECGKNLLQFFV